MNSKKQGMHPTTEANVLCQGQPLTFGIHQIYYETKLRKFLDSSFIPYENLKNERPEWREFHIFRKEWLAGTMERHDFTGFFSWKFRQKARIDGDFLLNFARANPGADCYFINPFPDEFIYFSNLWIQGEHHHRGLIETTEKIFRKLGYKSDFANRLHTSDIACYCNFWFANRRFWDAYMDYCLPVYDYIENEATEQERAILWARADKKSDATMVPYIFERLFTEFLATEPDLRVKAFRYSPEHFRLRFHECFDDFYCVSEALRQLAKESSHGDLRPLIKQVNNVAYYVLKPAIKKRNKRFIISRAWDKFECFLRLPPRVLPP